MTEQLIEFDQTQVLARLRALNLTEYDDSIWVSIVGRLNHPCAPAGIGTAITLGVVDGIRALKGSVAPEMLDMWRLELLSDYMPDLIKALVPDDVLHVAIIEQWRQAVYSKE